MTWFELYALFGVPAMVLVMAGGLYFYNRAQTRDRHHPAG
jgi:hypothetical protein